eukprot:CAMPEP_0114503234 /NCGR_PEP_ID=MMETSP0109-20121206/9537_1 /TAXON_ID=29199 /ORGANISM="Chlorarachnion reptans, Strain CCCM449" /LENGTH=91 /DNA_ID=CAMNT_0001681245 /DNA_START=913 /DNA_END=1185 /DNA_ORIENTATION=+
MVALPFHHALDLKKNLDPFKGGNCCFRHKPRSSSAKHLQHRVLAPALRFVPPFPPGLQRRGRHCDLGEGALGEVPTTPGRGYVTASLSLPP